MKKIKVELEFEVGTLAEVGIGGFKVSWVDSEHEGRDYSLTAGAGCGSSLLEASVIAPDAESIYARADIRELAKVLWPQLAREQDAVAAEIAQSESTP